MAPRSTIGSMTAASRSMWTRCLTVLRSGTVLTQMVSSGRSPRSTASPPSWCSTARPSTAPQKAARRPASVASMQRPFQRARATVSSRSSVGPPPSLPPPATRSPARADPRTARPCHACRSSSPPTRSPTSPRRSRGRGRGSASSRWRRATPRDGPPRSVRSGPARWPRASSTSTRRWSTWACRPHGRSRPPRRSSPRGPRRCRRAGRACWRMRTSATRPWPRPPSWPGAPWTASSSAVGRWRRATPACRRPGWPLADLWQALTTLREYRGDGHVAILTAAGLSPVEALVLYAGWQDDVSARFLQATRLWDDDAWEAAMAGLQARGLADDDGLTDHGDGLPPGHRGPHRRGGRRPVGATRRGRHPAPVAPAPADRHGGGRRVQAAADDPHRDGGLTGGVRPASPGRCSPRTPAPRRVRRPRGGRRRSAARPARRRRPARRPGAAGPTGPAAASATASSGTSTLSAIQCRAAQTCSPTRPAPSADAAMPDTSTSTGSPAARARCRVGVPSVSTATTRTSSRYQLAIPPISPPPPTATRSVSRSACCPASSRAIVPAPSSISGRS